MRKIEAIVREEKLQDVLDALTAAKITGITVYQVMGCGTQRGCAGVVRGQKVYTQLLPKIKFEIVVSDEKWEKIAVDAIRSSAATGHTATARSSPMISIPLSVSGREKRAMTPSTVQRWRSREKSGRKRMAGNHLGMQVRKTEKEKT